jgi:hypothetical protein
MTRTIASSQPLPVTEGYSAPARCPPANVLNRHWPRFAPLRAVMPTHRVLVSVLRSAWNHHLRRRSQSRPFPPWWADIGVYQVIFRNHYSEYARSGLRRQICPRLRKVSFLCRIGLNIDNGFAHSVGHSRSPSRRVRCPPQTRPQSLQCAVQEKAPPSYRAAMPVDTLGIYLYSNSVRGGGAADFRGLEE